MFNYKGKQSSCVESHSGWCCMILVNYCNITCAGEEKEVENYKEVQTFGGIWWNLMQLKRNRKRTNK